MDILSTSQEPHQPVNCSDCVVGYGQFYHLYSSQFEKIVQYCQSHGVLLSGKVCPHCNSDCRLDYHLKSWRCDKSVKVGHHKKRRRCNFRVSIYKNTWFEKAHLDIETNILFIKLFTLDCFSYKFASCELALCKKTINDWSSFAREVCVNYVVSRPKKSGEKAKLSK